MGVLSDQWRNRAAELNAALEPLLKSSAVTLELVQAVKAAVVPEVLLALADLLQVLESTPEQEAATRRLQKIVQRNEEVRLAAVRAINEGKYDDFDRIVAGTGSEPGAAG